MAFVDFLRRPPAARFTAADERYPGPPCGEGAGDFLADAPSGSGDYDDLVCELHVGLSGVDGLFEELREFRERGRVFPGEGCVRNDQRTGR